MDETETRPNERAGAHRHAKVLPPVKARQGAVSGRVLMVLAISLIVLALVYAGIWLFNARL